MSAFLAVVGLVADLHWLLTVVLVIGFVRDGRKSFGAWIDEQVDEAHKMLTLIYMRGGNE